MKTGAEWEAAFDVYYNNITSNQAPGLNTHEKCLFLTKAEYEITLDYFSANSKGNTLGQGFDDSAKRQADFSSLMMTTKADYMCFVKMAVTVVMTLVIELFLKNQELVPQKFLRKQ